LTTTGSFSELCFPVNEVLRLAQLANKTIKAEYIRAFFSMNRFTKLVSEGPVKAFKMTARKNRKSFPEMLILFKRNSFLQIAFVFYLHRTTDNKEDKL
jgi:hypothetical protein